MIHTVMVSMVVRVDAANPKEAEKKVRELLAKNSAYPAEHKPTMDTFSGKSRKM